MTFKKALTLTKTLSSSEDKNSRSVSDFDSSENCGATSLSEEIKP